MGMLRKRKLRWKRPFGLRSWFIQSKQPTAALSEMILHKANKPTGRPALGLGLALTNWITVQSSFYNSKRAADKDNRQQSWSQSNSWDLISGRLNFHLNQIRWLTDTVRKQENVWNFVAAWEIPLHCNQYFNTAVQCLALSLCEVSGSCFLFVTTTNASLNFQEYVRPPPFPHPPFLLHLDKSPSWPILTAF